MDLTVRGLAKPRRRDMAVPNRQDIAVKRPRVLFVQPSAQPPGGGNGVIAWMIHALQDECEVSLLTLEPFEAKSINRFYGTDIDATKVRAMRTMSGVHAVLERMPMPLALLKSSLLIASLRTRTERYDVVITANNEANLHTAGIQYVHYPTHLYPRPAVDLRGRLHDEVLLRPYHALCKRLSGASRDAVLRNVTLVNSDWTGAHMARAYPGVETLTVYPPVAGDFPDVPWDERASTFVAVGRLAPEKDYDRIFDILGAVRRRHPEVRLHVVGTREKGLAYSQHVLARAERERSWVTVHEDISRADLVALMARQRFGIHAMGEEHFGMGVAEMVRAGCIVWVPDGGGQVEIVGRDERLVYRSDAEAVEKICATLDDPERARALREHLRPYRERFSERVFVDRFREVVRAFLARRGDATPASSGRGAP